MSAASHPEPALFPAGAPILLGLWEPDPDQPGGVELRVDGALLGGLLPVPTAAGAPAIDHLLRHLTALLGWPDLDRSYDAPCLEAVRRHAEGAASGFTAHLRPRGSLAEWAGAAVAAINPVVGHRAVNPARPLGALYALARVEDLERADAELRPRVQLDAADDGRRHVDPRPVWRALLRDVSDDVPPSRGAARFIVALLDGLEALVADAPSGLIALEGPALSHPDFRTRLVRRLEARGHRVTPPTHPS